MNIRRLEKNSTHKNQLALADTARRLDSRLKNPRRSLGSGASPSTAPSPILEFENVSIKCLGGNEVVGVFRSRKFRLPLSRSSQAGLCGPPQFLFGPPLPRKNLYYGYQSLERKTAAARATIFMFGARQQEEEEQQDDEDRDQCFAPSYHGHTPFSFSDFSSTKDAQYFEMRFARYLNDATFLADRVKAQGKELVQARAQVVRTSAQDLDLVNRNPMGRRWENMAEVTDHLDIWRVLLGHGEMNVG